MLTNVYKLKVKGTKKYSKNTYTHAGAKKAKKRLAEKGIETEIKLLKKDVVILDDGTAPNGVVESFRFGTLNEIEKRDKKKASEK